MKRCVDSGGHEARTATSSPYAALRRFVAAHCTHPSGSPKVPACRCVSGFRKHTMNLFRTVLQSAALITAALLSLAGPAQAQHAGYRTFTIAGEVPATVALFYPTAVADRVVPMGPWQPVVAPGAPASEAPLKGLILISHGTGGTELNHHNLGTRLARDGYLVAAVRHAGDNWQDRSLVSSGRYFSERPRQHSRVLDALLASPEWGPRIPADRIGAVGHSAGGYSVLALAGAQAEPARAAQDDPGFCALAKGPSGGPAGSPAAASQPAPAVAAAAPNAELVSVADRRIRAVFVLAPMAVVLTPESLAAIRMPVRVLVAEKDAVLNTRYHGAFVVAHLPGARASTVAGAGHFAFMAQSTIPLPSAAGNAAANPPGFDRLAFLADLDEQVASFFAEQWR
jgi:predicted dienelactone hydrolase